MRKKLPFEIDCSYFNRYNEILSLNVYIYIHSTEIIRIIILRKCLKVCYLIYVLSKYDSFEISSS